jgi:ABC-type ATPase with predicted acetyltransferase domain
LYYSKKNMEPVEEEVTAIWTCSKEQCACWIRDNFAFDTTPTCPLCDSPMNKTTKVLPALHNHNKKG